MKKSVGHCHKCGHWYPLIDDRCSQCKEPAETFDTVTKPEHYNFAGIECIDAIKAALGPEGFRDYMMGNVLKYSWRYKYKNGLEDLKKAQWYLSRTITELENGQSDRKGDLDNGRSDREDNNGG